MFLFEMSSLSLVLGTKGNGGSSISSGEGRGSSISSGSWGSSISSDSRGSGSITNMLDRLSNSDGNLLNGVHRGVDGGDHFLSGVGGVGGMVDMRGLNDLLDRVDLVGSSHVDSTGNSDLIRGRDVL